MKKKIRLTESQLVNVIKRVIKEQSYSGDWSQMEKALKSLNNPKVIKFKYDTGLQTSLNWGSAKVGPSADWFLVVTSADRDLHFATKDENKAKIFKQITGIEPSFYGDKQGWGSSTNSLIDYSNVNSTSLLIKKLLSSFEN